MHTNNSKDLFSNQVKLLKENYQTFDADEKRILQNTRALTRQGSH